MKQKNKIFKYFCIVFFIIIFLYMLYLNTHTHKYHDEFVYTFIYGTTEKCENLGDVFLSLKNLYLMHNGRIISTGIMCILLMLPKIISDILNSIFFILLIYVIYKYSSYKQNTKNKFLNLFLIFPMLWATIPEFNGTVTWFSGAVNYMWATVFMMLFINLLINNFTGNLNLSKKSKILLSILGLFVGSLHESVGIILTSFVFFIFIYELFINKKLNYFYLFSCVSSFIGFLTIIVSPGSHIRSIATTLGNNLDFYTSLSNCIKMIKFTFVSNPTIFILTFLFIAYFIIKNKFIDSIKNKYFIVNIFLIISATLVYFAMILSPTFAQRVTFASYIIYVLVFFEIFNLINLSNNFKYLIKFILIIYFCFLALPSIYETTNLVNQYYSEWSARDDFIKLEKSLGKRDVQVAPFHTFLNSKMYGGDISTSISYNHNGSMAMYYGLNSIRIKKNYYIDFCFSNLCQEDNMDNFTLSNSSETSTESISILPEYVLNEQAPYKKSKHSCIGGNITLYYGINSLKNLKLYLHPNSNQIYLNYIRVYNYNDLDYTIYGSNIKNKIISFHNLQFFSENNSLVFTQFGENPWIEFKF